MYSGAPATLFNTYPMSRRGAAGKLLRQMPKDALASAHCSETYSAAYTEEPLVSSDFRGDAHSAVVDGLSTMVQGFHFVKVVAWYDNE